MVNITVLKPFYDLKAHCDRKPGDVFEATKERAERLQVLLPGYFDVERDYSSMSVQELSVIAKERGVLPKGRVSKAALIEILSKE